MITWSQWRDHILNRTHVPVTSPLGSLPHDHVPPDPPDPDDGLPPWLASHVAWAKQVEAEKQAARGTVLGALGATTAAHAITHQRTEAA